ncbi:MAG: hypothetical protein LBU32_12240 [Clostridiales bacterium]|nr:hypothetical protein [Clostridiales bacterium]
MRIRNFAAAFGRALVRKHTDFNRKSPFLESLGILGSSPLSGRPSVSAAPACDPPCRIRIRASAPAEVREMIADLQGFVGVNDSSI